MLSKVEARERRKKRVRKKIFGTPERPRLSVFRSNRHIYAQIIDDVNGLTLVSASTLEQESGGNNINCELSRKVGSMLGKRALEKGVKKVVFDRSGYKYHGNVKSLAEGAREAGLEF